MPNHKKWKIFGVQTNIEWYDVKTKFKKILRKVTYSWLFQELICLLISSYMKLVYHTSKKTFINHQILIDYARDKKPLLVSCWHNRLMMAPFVTIKPKKLNPSHNFMALTSKHGDGRFVGRVMEKFGLIAVFGSSKAGRKASRGIDIAGMKQILSGLKKGNHLGITPDGPRGPNQKINGDILNLARLSGAGIIASSYSSSRFKRLKSWDRFFIPLPFSNLCFYFDQEPFFINKEASQTELAKLEPLIEERMNFVQDQSEKIATNAKN
jgi:lysophospholipid acyltransferase (LPLAT)-like uncharacterized protein